ncbi:HD domain-containing phosphohydrolase [Ferrimonas balearica]|uniref:HD domain-containing phosphohydrolase n=1 Tax=Ferrimonas balearica TaxID=44012 RepID=UPI001C55A93E|nr:HD domain-containing phosphohydrolase [Ferrimonas balearica]MBW3163182.1 transporter substrate-binding domain-containing protein [Ferrimonas balearica]
MAHGRKYSIRVTVGGLLILATLITGLVALALQFHFTKEMTQEGLLDRLGLTSEAISADIAKLDRDAHFTGQLLSQVAKGALAPEQQQRRIELLKQTLDGNPQFYGAYFGHGDGEFVQLMNLNASHVLRENLGAQDSDRWALVHYEQQSGQRVRVTRLLDDNLNQTHREQQPDNYQPSQRAWYKGAMRNGSYKTDPYLFHTVEINGQTYAHRVADTDVVVGIDVVLSSIARKFNDYTRYHDVIEATEAYFFDHHGEIIAANQTVPASAPLPPSRPLPLSAEQQEYIAQLGTLTVSNQDAWEPMDFSLGGVPKGYAIDMFALISEMTGIPFHFSNGQSWSQLRRGFIDGDIDILHSVQRNLGSRHLGLFSSPMYTMPFALMTKESTPVTRLGEWQGRRLGMIAGWSIIPALRTHYPHLEVVEFYDLKPAFDALRDGQIDGVIDASDVLRYKVSQYYFGDATIHENLSDLDNRYDGHFYLVVNSEKPQLHQILNLALANISQEQRTALAQKWLQAENGRPSARFASIVPHKAVLDIIEREEGLGQLQRLTLNNEPAYVYVEHVGNFNQLKDYIAVILPESHVDQLVLQRIAPSALVTAAIILALLPLAWAFSRPIVRPILQLRRATIQIEKRQFDQVEPVQTNIKELDDLSRSVSQMANTINAHEKAQQAFIESFIELIANAIDDKSPYTAGHCHRVPELGLMLAEAAEQCQEGQFAGFAFANEDERREFRIAAWLHDCGKITTPEHIVDKGTKLEAIYNRIHEIRMRFEVLWRDAEIEALKAMNATPEQEADIHARLLERQQQLQEQYAFVANCNVGGEFFDEARIQQLHDIGAQTWLRHFDDRIGLSPQEETLLCDDARPLPAVEPLLADRPEHKVSARHDRENDPALGITMVAPQLEQNLGELYNLSVGRGTLTAEDRYRINEHMVSGIKMLASLPFPPELSRVPRYATSHHETLDGKGYPRGLVGEQMSIPEQILVLSDIFEALTASDRPYKRAKPLSVAIDIMHKMALNRHFDPALFRLFLSSGTYLRYARAHLAPEQIDHVDIGKYLKTEGADAPKAAVSQPEHMTE